MKAGWEVKPLGEVCEIYQPKTILKKEMLVDGAYPVFGANGIIGRFNDFNHEKPQLLITCRGATCGAVNISDPFSWITGNAMVVRPIIESLNQNYLKYFFLGGVDLNGVITGAAQPQITRASLAPVTLYIPPLEEQKRIVAVLDKAFEGLDRAKQNAQANLQSAKELFESQRKSILEHVGLNQPLTTLNDVCIVQRGSSPRPIKKFQTNEPTGVNWIKIGDTKQGGKYITATKEKITPEGAEKSRRVEVGDLILTNSMTFGRPYIMAIDGYIHDGWFVLRLNDGLDSNYFYHLLSSSVVQDQFNSLAAGSVVKNISGDLVKKAIFGIPCLSSQIEVALNLDQLSLCVDELSAQYQTKLQDIADLRQSLLQKAFAGELT